MIEDETTSASFSDGLVSRRSALRGAGVIAAALALGTASTQAAVAAVPARAEQFVALCESQKGKKYVWGAAGPDSFDCSGLIYWALAQMGIPSVHQSASLINATSRITTAQGATTRGALLYRPGHIAVSLGDGRTIEAMNPANGVRYGSATPSSWTAAGIIPQLAAAPAPNPPAVPPRIAVLGGDGQAVVKEGNLWESWQNMGIAGKQVVVEGWRTGVLTTDGVLYVKEGALNAQWSVLFRGATSFTMSGQRVGVIDTAGTAWVKEGALNAGWTNMSGAVTQIALDGDRVAILGSNGVASIKEGNLLSDWVAQYNAAKSIALGGTRIGVITSTNAALVKEGNLWESWTEVAGDVAVLTLTPDRVGIVGRNGVASIKEGGLSTGWLGQTPGNTTDIRLVRNRIGVRLTDGSIFVKEGTPYEAWVGQLAGKSVSLS